MQKNLLTNCWYNFVRRLLTYGCDKGSLSSRHDICIPEWKLHEISVFIFFYWKKSFEWNLTSGFWHDPFWQPGNTWHSLHVGPDQPNLQLRRKPHVQKRQIYYLIFHILFIPATAVIWYFTISSCWMTIFTTNGWQITN